MNTIDSVSAALKGALCGSLDVSAVPIGYAISTGFSMPDGDLLSFYLLENPDGTFQMEDDGMTLPMAIASGLDLKSPVREGLLRGILSDEGLRYDDDLSIRSSVIEKGDIGPAALRFMSALIRMRDLTLISRENVAASFADDVRNSLRQKIPSDLELTDDGRPADLSGPDIVVRQSKTGLKVAKIYAASGDLRLMDALVDYQASANDGEARVLAVVDRRKGRVTDRRLNTATNKGLPMAVIDGSGDDWTSRVVGIVKDSNFHLGARIAP